ncbi:hypothetical protein Q3G72_034423 [Acer saccharum]|nr:hypothetical protein Q3G72_034423 [Acer saccharum]
MNHSLLQFVKKANSLKSFKSIHSHLIISGSINSSDLILNKLLRIYSRFGAIDYGRKLFDEIPKPNEFLWTALIHGYVENYRYAEAFSMFVQMLSESVTLLNFTIASVLKSLAREKRVNEGKGIYGFVLKSGFSFDLIVQNSVLDLFMRCGETDFVRWAFDEMDEKDVVSWNTMVSGYGYAKNGHPRNALELYKSFKEQGIKPDETFILGIISACLQLGILDTAESIIHDFSEPSFFPNLRVVNSLIDMYAKCGSIERAKQVFEMAHQKDLLCYSTMIVAFANNGLGQDAISLFDEMQRANIRPDGVAFLGVLTACNHGGLVNEGKLYFKQMIDEYGIQPSEKHYACVVDLLGRSGCLDEAHNIIKNMPIAPHSAVWGALLAACRVHCNVQLAEVASAELFKIEPYNSVFEQVTKKAVLGIWACRSKLNLVGAHINVFTGEWTQKHGQKSYPLRPELIESTYWLYKATRDPRYLAAGRDMIASFQFGARCPCGYCHISDVEFHKKEDHMESFFLAETVKYLWLLFDLAVGPENLVENGPYRYIFSTEGHLLPATPQISLAKEHCSYFGAYCKSGDSKEKSDTLDVSDDPQETNGSKVFGDRSHTGFPSDSFLGSIPATGLIKAT